MLEKEFFNLILQDFPESVVVTFVCFVILNLKLNWKNILFISLLQAFTNLVRLLPIAFGMHTIILTISLVLYIGLITKSKFSKNFIAVITCTVIVVISQAIYYNPMLRLFNLDYQNAVSNPITRAIFSIPEYISLLLVPFVKKIYGRHKHKNIHF